MFSTLEVVLKCLPMPAGPTHITVGLAGIEGMAQAGNSWLLECFTEQNKCHKVSGCACVCVCFFATCLRVFLCNIATCVSQNVTDNHLE